MHRLAIGDVEGRVVDGGDVVARERGHQLVTDLPSGPGDEDAHLVGLRSSTA